MPTNLDRVQVLLQPDTFAKMKTMAKGQRRTYSAMCAELIEAAMKMPIYREAYEEACLTVGEVPAKPDPRLARKQEALRPESYRSLISKDDAEMVQSTGLDKLTPERIKELMTLLETLDKLRS